MSKDLNGYELSRKWFNYCFDNPEKIKPNHTAIYFFAIEHCNRLGWKDKFGFPSQMVMEGVGIKNWRTYSSALNDLVDFGFIKMIEISKNQYSSNIIAIVKNTKATTKALDKALHNHSTKQSQSIVSIDKQITNNNITNNNHVYSFDNFWNDYDKKIGLKEKIEKKFNKLSNEDLELIKIHIPKYKLDQVEKKYRKNPEAYLNNKSWLDEVGINSVTDIPKSEKGVISEHMMKMGKKIMS